MGKENNFNYSVLELAEFLGLSSNKHSLPKNGFGLKKLMHAYHNLGPCFFTITDFVNMNYLYVSPSTKYLTGYSSEQWMKGGLQFAFSLHPVDDMQYQKLVHQEIIRFHNALSMKDKNKYKYCFNMRVRRTDGKYVNMLGQLICLKSLENGNPWLVLGVFTDISFFKPDNSITLTICKVDEVSGFSETVYNYVPILPGYSLSGRQVEIYNLVKNGHSSKEIAKKLNLSKSTIDTHRRNIRKKTDLL